MTQGRYRELLMDNAVFPIGSDNHLFILSKSGEMIIELYCISLNDFKELYSEIKSRLLLFVYPGKNIPDGVKVLKTEKPKSLIMLDCAESETAYTYQLTINEKERSANIILYDMPEQGQMYISASAVRGLSKKMWTPSFFKEK